MSMYAILTPQDAIIAANRKRRMAFTASFMYAESGIYSIAVVDLDKRLVSTHMVAASGDIQFADFEMFVLTNKINHSNQVQLGIDTGDRRTGLLVTNRRDTETYKLRSIVGFCKDENLERIIRIDPTHPANALEPSPRGIHNLPPLFDRLINNHSGYEFVELEPEEIHLFS